MWAIIPVLGVLTGLRFLFVPVAIIMLLLRPIYVLALCDLYSDYLESMRPEKGKRDAVIEIAKLPR